MRNALAGLMILAAVACATAPDGADIRGSSWTLVEMYGEPVAPGDTNRPVTLTLEPGGDANGSSGCNQFGGQYTLAGRTLTFGTIAMTRMACDRGMDVETRYGSVLDRTRTWMVQDGMLHLIGADGTLARFRRD